jgi:hypothetical protein
MSPVTMGVSDASQVAASAAFPSSQAPPSLPLSAAAARAAAHRARTSVIHSSHRFRQRVVVPLPLSPVILASGRGG